MPVIKWLNFFNLKKDKKLIFSSSNILLLKKNVKFYGLIQNIYQNRDPYYNRRQNIWKKSSATG